MAENYYLDMLRRLRFKLESEEELTREERSEFEYLLRELTSGKIILVDASKFKKVIEIDEQMYDEMGDAQKEELIERTKNEFVYEVAKRYDL